MIIAKYYGLNYWISDINCWCHHIHIDNKVVETYEKVGELNYEKYILHALTSQKSESKKPEEKVVGKIP